MYIKRGHISWNAYDQFIQVNFIYGTGIWKVMHNGKLQDLLSVMSIMFKEFLSLVTSSPELLLAGEQEVLW